MFNLTYPQNYKLNHHVYFFIQRSFPSIKHRTTICIFGSAHEASGGDRFLEDKNRAIGLETN